MAKVNELWYRLNIWLDSMNTIKRMQLANGYKTEAIKYVQVKSYYNKHVYAYQ